MPQWACLQARRSFAEEVQIEGVQILTYSLEDVLKPISSRITEAQIQVKRSTYTLSQVLLATDSGFSEVLKRPRGKGLAQSLQKREMPTDCRVSLEETTLFHLELP